MNFPEMRFRFYHDQINSGGELAIDPSRRSPTVKRRLAKAVDWMLSDLFGPWVSPGCPLPGLRASTSPPYPSAHAPVDANFLKGPPSASARSLADVGFGEYNIDFASKLWPIMNQEMRKRMGRRTGKYGRDAGGREEGGYIPSEFAWEVANTFQKQDWQSFIKPMAEFMKFSTSPSDRVRLLQWSPFLASFDESQWPRLELPGQYTGRRYVRGRLLPPFLQISRCVVSCSRARILERCEGDG